MKNIIILMLLSLLAYGCSSTNANKKATTNMEVAEHWKHSYLGHFKDDYGIEYEVKNDLWIQLPDIKYHILEWNEKGKFIIARNYKNNPSDKKLYTRIDLTNFENMGDFKWGFCLTKYDATSFNHARNWDVADNLNPKTGCNGFPFSRMKRVMP